MSRRMTVVFQALRTALPSFSRAMLSNDALDGLNGRFPCREEQLQQLSFLVTRSFADPPIIVLHGLEGTGKTSITKAYLAAAKVRHAIIPCRECITGRHLLERIVTECVNVLSAAGSGDIDRSSYSRCENLLALTNHLRRLFEDRGRFVLVLDGVDRQREAPPTLLPALARLGHVIPNLSVILIVKLADPSLLHKPGVPFVEFPSYTRDQAIQILALAPPPIFPEPPSNQDDYTEDKAAEDDLWLWTRFCGAVWDSLAKGAARDLVRFRDLAQRLWRPFVEPIVEGSYGTRDFTRLLVAKRSLFQDDDVLIDAIIPKLPGQSRGVTLSDSHDLPYYSKYLLCVAYLASYNPSKQDAIYFMKSSEKKRRKRGGMTAGKNLKHRKIPRHLLTPSPFSLDRVLAILHALIPHSVPQSADIYTQIATLSSIRLLVRSGTLGGDLLDPNIKWRVNFGWDFASALGRGVGLEIRDYLASSGD